MTELQPSLLLLEAVEVQEAGTEFQCPLLPADLAYKRPPSVLGQPAVTPLLVASSLRRSGRLAAKMKGSSEVGAASMASLLKKKRFASASVVSMARKLNEAAKESFISILSNPLDQDVVQAIKALVGIEGKAQVDLPAMGLTVEDLSALAQEIAAA